MSSASSSASRFSSFATWPSASGPSFASRQTAPISPLPLLHRPRISISKKTYTPSKHSLESPIANELDVSRKLASVCWFFFFFFSSVLYYAGHLKIFMLPIYAMPNADGGSF